MTLARHVAKRRCASAHQARHPPGLQARRHLRRRVRGADAVPVLDLREAAGRETVGGAEDRGRERSAPDRQEEDRSSAAVPTASARASSSTTAASTRVLALREDGFETIMVNCNPETVSTDYDTSDRLYFEPLTLEDVLAILDVEKPEGVIVQFGGQTPLRLAVPLARGREGAGHQRRRHRPRRGSRAVRRAAAQARAARAAPGHRPRPRGGARRSPTGSATR